MFTTNIEFRKLTPQNKTCVSQSQPWGLFHRKGTRLLCADGVVRSVSYLANTADTFFSVPAAVRIKGKYITGYMTPAECSLSELKHKTTRKAYTFRHHDGQEAKHSLPAWPVSFSKELWDLLGKVSEDVDANTGK